MAVDRRGGQHAASERCPVIDGNNVLVGFIARWSDIRWDALAPDGAFHGAFPSRPEARCALVDAFSPSRHRPAGPRCDLVVAVDRVAGLAWCAEHRVDPAKLVTWDQAPDRLEGTSRLRVRLLATPGPWPEGWKQVAIAVSRANASYV